MNHPELMQLNTRILLEERGRELGRPASLDDLPDAMFKILADAGFAWIWLLGVWQTGPKSRHVSRNQPESRKAFLQDLPDLTEKDVTGSPFAVQAYSVRQEIGGDEALKRIRARLAKLGLRLMLDFVPNHVGLDHPWVDEHPEFFIEGDEQAMANAPQNYVSLETKAGPRVLAYGRDPYFPGWSDSLQLNYRHAGLRAAVIEQLRSVTQRCDGVRCDMAMLLLPDVFRRTWGDASLPRDGSKPVDTQFWPEAIARVRRDNSGFTFLAEVYWGLEHQLQQQGFDYTYDKGLYDRLRGGDARSVRDYLEADPDFQRKSARFLENHDEPRAAAVFPWAMHQAAAIITYLVPGLRFFHEGQFEGRTRHGPMQLGRRPFEVPDSAIQAFYRRLVSCLQRPEVHEGEWHLWDLRQAWEGNGTWDHFLVFTWRGSRGNDLLIAVNYGPTRGQCYSTIDVPGWRGKRWILKDLMGEAQLERDGNDLAGDGLYLDMEPWAYSVFEVTEASGKQRPASRPS